MPKVLVCVFLLRGDRREEEVARRAWEKTEVAHLNGWKENIRPEVRSRSV
jgi:hypothetical protein